MLHTHYYHPYTRLVLNMGSGFLFGPYIGMVTAVVGMNIGAVIAFYLGRYFLYRRVQAKVEAFKYYRVSNLVACAALSLCISLILRLSTCLWKAAPASGRH